MKLMKPRLATVAAYMLPCVAAAQASYEGVWSGAMTTPNHEHWKVEDITHCWAGCPLVPYRQFGALIDDPANDELSWEELEGRYYGSMAQHLRSISTDAGLDILNGSTDANNPSIHCHDYGYMRQSLNPLPMAITRNGDTLTFKYEEWNQERTVYMDGRDFPANLAPSQFGYSIGHMDNGDLVIETRGIAADIYNPFSGGGGYSDQVVGMERYSLAGNPPVLSVVMTLTDPVTLKEPYLFHKEWIATPDLVLLEDSCVDVPGEF